MSNTSDRDRLLERLKAMLTALQKIPRRFASISEPNDFLSSEEGGDRIKAMAIIAILCQDRRNLQDRRAMKTMNVSLPDPMRDYVDRQVQSGGYGSASEYIRDLIRQDQKRKAQEQLETMLLEGLNSGDATQMSDAPPLRERDWQEIRQAVRDKLNQQQHG
ncbi:type II toxin-antitoxin system ParD family antitoxin [Roseofilum sp. BLCC_M91]|uniref:Type II toxin-antitoxin system ParD family antitoxin n=1 Tax=Roseofilum halophilum BLCC-M91 TaxID=3022259 RepID=A0ABT7BLH5_9CYAN|nr:type II toxin-antitoxin system ParD family antitoxin [Roseofilum halophilum]MDJ1180025.1 type II toxin-antitoxin system ParD family antitoxin [Roseofilum halophilum BLCC-M91]